MISSEGKKAWLEKGLNPKGYLVCKYAFKVGYCCIYLRVRIINIWGSSCSVWLGNRRYRSIWIMRRRGQKLPQPKMHDASAVWSVWLTIYIYRVDSSANTILTNTRFTPMIIRLFVGESWEFLRHSWLRSHRRTSIDPRGCFKTVTIHVSSSHDQHDQCTCYDYLLLGWGECYRRSHYFQWRESPSVSDQRWIIHRNLVWDPK